MDNKQFKVGTQPTRDIGTGTVLYQVEPVSKVFLTGPETERHEFLRGKREGSSTSYDPAYQ